MGVDPINRKETHLWRRLEPLLSSRSLDHLYWKPVIQQEQEFSGTMRDTLLL